MGRGSRDGRMHMDGEKLCRSSTFGNEEPFLVSRMVLGDI